MAITDRLYRLGDAAQVLNHGSDQLNRTLSQIDRGLSRLMIGMDYVHPRPLQEAASVGRDGKRVIELSFLGYLKVERGYHLAIKTVKVVESRAAVGAEAPGEVVPLMSAPRRLRHLAVDVLPDLVGGLAELVSESVEALEERQAVANRVLHELENLAGVDASASSSDHTQAVATSAASRSGATPQLGSK